MVFLLNRLVIAGHELIERRFGEPGFLLLPESGVGIAEQTVDEGVERVDLNGFLKRAARFLKVLGRKPGSAQLDVGVDVVRIDVESLLE